MEYFFLSILDMSLTAGFVILAVFVIRFFLRRAPKRYSYLLWALAGFRLIFPFSFSSALSLFNLPIFTGRGIGISHVPSFTGGELSQIKAHLSQSSVSQAVPLLTQANPSGSMDPWQPILAAASLLWITGALLLLLYTMISWLRTRKLVQNAVLYRDNIYECDAIPSPFVMGIFKPRIYIPFHMPENSQAMILIHEECHIRRKDHLVRFFAWLLVCIYWFHPLVWAAWRTMTKDMEMSCDEWVLRILGEDKKTDYSSTLLEFAAKETLPAGNILGFGKNNIKNRIQNILRFHRTGPYTIGLLTLLVVSAAAILCTNRRETASLPSAEGTRSAEHALTEASEASSTSADILYALKNPYAGDATADSQLLYCLADLGFLPMDSFSFQLMTDKEPYGMEIVFSSEPEDLDTALLQLGDAGNLLLALIDNLSEVRFTFPDKDSSVTLYWDLEAANASLAEKEDIKNYGHSKEKLAALLSGIPSFKEASDSGETQDKSISVIGGADGPTSVFIAGKHSETETKTAQ